MVLQIQLCIRYLIIFTEGESIYHTIHTCFVLLCSHFSAGRSMARSSFQNCELQNTKGKLVFRKSSFGCFSMLETDKSAIGSSVLEGEVSRGQQQRDPPHLQNKQWRVMSTEKLLLPLPYKYKHSLRVFFPNDHYEQHEPWRQPSSNYNIRAGSEIGYPQNSTSDTYSCNTDYSKLH